jgi:hypothetical protein
MVLCIELIIEGSDKPPLACGKLLDDVHLRYSVWLIDAVIEPYV